MSKSTPFFSVVMPVHNGRPFLDESISSIVNQTLADFEFIILDDASTDDSGSVVRQWEKPDRLRRQWQVIESRPDVFAVGTLFDGIDAAGRRVRPRDRWRLVRRSPYIPFAHGSAMFRKEAYEAIGGYCQALA